MTVVVAVLTDSAVKLAQASAPAGAVKFSVTNAGSVTHELVVLKTAIAQNQLPANLSQPAEVTEPGFLAKVPLLAPGQTGSLTLTLTPGSYVLICNQPAHYLVGMHTAFTVN